MSNNFMPADRRSLLKWSGMIAGSAGLGVTPAFTQSNTPATSQPAPAGSPGSGTLGSRIFSFNLAHEQFPAPQLVQFGAQASAAGFQVLSTSDHLQPWQDNQGHAGQAWVTLSNLGSQSQSWIGTTVTCPTFRYNPAVVAEAFATLSLFYPGRVFLSVGSGEALNEQAATGSWPRWRERWSRLIEAIQIIRELWTGQPVAYQGRYYNVNAKLYDPPAAPIPLLTAANGPKSMRLAGKYGDGLVSDPMSWNNWKPHWRQAALNAGKNPDTMPVLVEQYVVVGDQSAALEPAELWRFTPKAWTGLFDDPSPVDIRQTADATIPISQVIQNWVISSDPAVHVQAMQQLFDSGVTIINVHSGQADQAAVIDFYGKYVLPQFR